jgi:hypothetical protein
VEEQSAEEALSGIVDERETTRPADHSRRGGVAFRRKAGRGGDRGWNKWRLHASAGETDAEQDKAWCFLGERASELCRYSVGSFAQR